MPGILVVLFWCWFAVSIVILVRRGLRKTGRSTHRTATPNEPARPPVIWPPLDEIDPLREPAMDGTDVVATAPSATSAPPVTIVEALQGIRMPCDLAPLTAPEAGIDFERRAAFYTVGWPAEAVAPEIADELERLGMSFDALSDNTAVATRDDLRVRVAVRAVGSAFNGVADMTYPTAPEHSVVVEFELT